MIQEHCLRSDQRLPVEFRRNGHASCESARFIVANGRWITNGRLIEKLLVNQSGYIRILIMQHIN